MRFLVFFLCLAVFLSALSPANPILAGTTYSPPTRSDFKKVRDRMLPEARQACIEIHKSPSHPFCKFRIRLVSGGKDGAFARFSIDTVGRPRIRISTQMLGSFGNIDELALVMGHEIGHQLADHVNASQRNLLRNALNEDEQSSGSQKRAVETTLKRDREFELIADQIGAILMLRAGFDLDNAISLIDRMRTNPKRLTTHPPHPLRKKVVLRTGRAFKNAKAKGKRLALPL